MLAGNNPINLTQNKEIPVQVRYPDGEIAYTKITLEYGNSPQILLRGDIRDRDIVVQPVNDEYFDSYYISNIFKYNFFVPSIFKYLYIGNADKNNLKKIYFTIPELSSYFHQELQYSIDNNANISGSLKVEQLEAMVENQGLSIKIHQGYSLKSNKGHTGFSFTNIIYFSFESETALSFQEIESLMYKTIGLLTWITGYPVTVESIDVSDGEKDGYLYLPLVKKLEKHDASFPKSFMHVVFLRKYFNIICNCYFNESEIFSDIWSRTLPLFDFTGVLEYEVMLYASILDKYFSHQVDKLNRRSPQNYDQYIIKVDRFLKNSNEFKKILEGTDLIGKIKTRNIFPKEKFLSFIEKQEIYFQHIGEENFKIFLNTGDFKNIKNIRDRAAHGSKEELGADDVLKYLWKVKLLVMYLIYLDLGIEETDFFKILSNTLHPIRMNCEINRYLLDLKIGKTILIELSRIEKEKMDNLDAKIKVFYNMNNSYQFDPELSQLAHDYFSEDVITEIDSSRFYSYEKYVQFLINKRNVDLNAKYYDEAYLKENESNILISNVIILS